MHTPGPWRVLWANDNDTGLQPYVIATQGRGFEVASVNRLDAALCGDVAANARLVAASPELLAALKAIMNGQLCGDVDLDAPRFEAARAAIAKAEGGAP